jgi:competence protein ComEA
VGSRVHDALDSAGGLLPEASTQSLNLAAPLQDGVRIFVPSQGQTGSEPGDESQTSEVATGNPININIATQAELESLPHIGPSLAGEIITYRQEHGPFSTIEEIMNVPGIGQGIFEEIKNWIVVQ